MSERIKTVHEVEVDEANAHPINIPRIAVKDSRADVTLARAQVAHDKSRADAEIDRIRDEKEDLKEPIDAPLHQAGPTFINGPTAAEDKPDAPKAAAPNTPRNESDEFDAFESEENQNTN